MREDKMEHVNPEQGGRLTGTHRGSAKLRWIPRLLALVVLLVVAFAFGAMTAEAFPNPFGWLGGAKPTPSPAQAEVPPPAPATAPLGGVPQTFAPIADAVRPAVVNVATTQTVHARGPGGAPGSPFGGNDPFEQFFHRFFGPMPRNFTRRSLGSGVIIDNDEGYVVTNAHVIAHADKIVVTLGDGREFDAKVVGSDEKTDVALLKIKSPGDLAVAKFGDSDAVHVGDWVVAIGNPFGLSETVTAGIISAKGRVIGEGPYEDFIQTDASINPGNSGGPLVSTSGNVIGINSAIFSQSGGNIGIGFAIPINLVRSVVEQLREHGKVIRGWLGVTIQPFTPELSQSFGLEKAEGALVAEVSKDSPAAKAGFERGDIIVEYDGKSIGQAHRLPTLVAETAIGQKVPVVVLRNGERKTLDVTVGQMPENVAAAGGPPEAESEAGDWGLTVANITPDVAQQLGLKETRGVVVTGVANGSMAAEAGLQPGDVILEVDRQKVQDVQEFRKALAKAGKSSQLLLLVNRQGQTLFVALSRGS